MSNPLLARFDGEPALVNPEIQGRFTALLNGVMQHELASVVQATEFSSEGEFWTELGEYRTKMLRPYAVRDGVLHIPVKGVLLKDFPYQFFDYATGYEYIRMAFDRGLADPAVKGIALVFDTPGGMVAGNFDLVDHIYESRGIKPIVGIADEDAYSAGYSLISAADSVNVARTGGLGSIGVVTSHTDASAAMDKRGLKITFIHAGKFKVEGNPYEALSDEARERIQTRIDGLYSIFVSTVARNRGIDEGAVRATEALTFSADEAVSNGLADSIGPFEDAIVAFATSISKEGDEIMSFTQEQLDAAVATATATATDEGMTAGKAVGATEERERISAIVNSEAGQARPKAALKMATNEKFAAVDADAIVDMLGDLPEESATAPDGDGTKTKDELAEDFAKTMDKANHPNAGAPSVQGAAQTEDERVVAETLASIGVNYAN